MNTNSLRIFLYNIKVIVQSMHELQIYLTIYDDILKNMKKIKQNLLHPY